MAESTPRVSIVLPTYNGAKYLRQSIDSCLNQSYNNIELVIVDDGSSDETRDVIESYTDSRIKYIKHKTNYGLPIALNTGFAHATGSYLSWTSDDNYYAQNAIEKALTLLLRTNFLFVYCDYYTFEGENIAYLHKVKLPDKLELEKNNDVGPCILYSRKVFDAIGDFDPKVKLAEDYDYWIRVWKKFPMVHLAEPLYFYRNHQHSLTTSRFFEIKTVKIIARNKNDLPSDFHEQRFMNFIIHGFPDLPGVGILAKMMSTLLYRLKITAYVLNTLAQLEFRFEKIFHLRIRPPVSF